MTDDWKGTSRIITSKPQGSEFDPKEWPNVEALHSGEPLMKGMHRYGDGVKYSEDQERDWHGRFAGPGSDENESPHVIEIMTSEKLVQPTDLRDRSGKPLTLSVHALENDLAEIRPGVPIDKATTNKVTAGRIAAAAEKSTFNEIEKQTGIRPDPTEHGVASISKNLGAVAESAIARYNAPEVLDEKTHEPLSGPRLIERDRFYEQFHNTSGALANETGMPWDRVVAGLAALSPGKDASQNLREGSDLVRMMTQNGGLGPRIEGSMREAFLERLDNESARYQRDADNASRTRDANEALKSRDALTLAADMIRSGNGDYMNQLPGLAAARFASDYRIENSQGLPPGLHEDADPRYSYEPKNGFGVGKTGWAPYADAINVMRGHDVVDAQGTERPVNARDVLDVKTGSFHNNIADPFDEQGMHSLTVDFHMADAATNMNGFGSQKPGYTAWESSPTVAGVPLGMRANIADGVRELIPTFAKALNEPNLSTGRAQEILWAEIIRLGKSNTYFGGTPYEPLDIRPSKAKK